MSDLADKIYSETGLTLNADAVAGIARIIAAAVPEGHVVVPRVATLEMIRAGYEAGCSDDPYDKWVCLGAAWAAMVEAAGKENKE